MTQGLIFITNCTRSKKACKHEAIKLNCHFNPSLRDLFIVAGLVLRFLHAGNKCNRSGNMD